MCFLRSSPEVKQKSKREWESTPWMGIGVQCFLQAFHDKGDRREGILSYLW
jgi:hypothetical protein